MIRADRSPVPRIGSRLMGTQGAGRNDGDTHTGHEQKAECSHECPEPETTFGLRCWHDGRLPVRLTELWLRWILRRLELRTWWLRLHEIYPFCTAVKYGEATGKYRTWAEGMTVTGVLINRL